MYKCLGCGNRCVSTWQTFWATRLRPTCCRLCGEQCYIPIKYSLAIYYRILLPSLLIWFLVIFLKNGWVLLVFIPLFAWSIARFIKDSNLVLK